MINITLSFSSFDAAIAAMRSISYASATPAVEVAQPDQPVKVVKAEKPAAQAPSEATKPVASPEPVAESPSEDDPAVSYDDTAKAVLAYSKAKGRAATLELLSKFSLVSLLGAKDKPELLPSIKAEFEAAL